MNLNFGKTYVLYTEKRTINGIRVKVVGIVDYVNSKRIPYQLSTLAINEQVVSTDASDNTLETYLSDKQFYVCKDDNGSYYVVWPEIIDSEATISAVHVSKAAIQLTIENDVGVSDDTIYNFITTSLTTEYLGKVTAQISSRSSIESTKSMEDVYRELISESKGVLENFRSLSSLIPFLNKIDALNLEPKMNDIQNSIETIKTSVARIAAVIR